MTTCMNENHWEKPDPSCQACIAEEEERVKVAEAREVLARSLATLERLQEQES